MEGNPTEYYELPNGIEDSPIVIDELYRQIPDRVAVIESSVAFWAVIDGVLLVFILCGNILTILAVRLSRRLRAVISNMFILSLAISDVVVGFTLPYHLAFYMGSGLGRSQTWCLLRFFLIILACCVSIWNLIAIAVDRYIAIVYPLHYSRYMTRKVAIFLLGIGWILGATVALIPMFWNNWSTATSCEFDEILPPWYMAGVITPGFSLVWVCMLIVYWRIWREASKHAKQLRSSFTGIHDSPSDWKSVQVVLFILGCFSICWLPYFIVACAQIFKFLEDSSPILYKGAFSLAMANSGINPIIYAWKNTSFRRAFARLLRCKSPDYVDVSQHSTRSNIHRKSSTLQQQQDHVTMTPPNSAISGNFNEFSDNIVAKPAINQNDEYALNDRQIAKRTTSISASTLLPITQTVVLANGTTVMNGKDTGFDKANAGLMAITKPTRAKNLLIQQIECDGNGNTQIRIVSNTDDLEQRENLNDLISMSLNDRKVSNGNLIINSLNNFSNQLV